MESNNLQNSLEILYNSCYGGFGLSYQFKNHYNISDYNRERYDPSLISKVKEFGLKQSSGKYSKLKIKKIEYNSKIPLKYIENNIKIHEYDGIEHIEIDKSNILVQMIEDKLFKNIEEVYEMNELIKTIKNNTIS